MADASILRVRVVSAASFESNVFRVRYRCDSSSVAEAGLASGCGRPSQFRSSQALSLWRSRPPSLWGWRAHPLVVPVPRGPGRQKGLGWRGL